jgi:hydroxyacylglutathione hydrolase
MSQARALIIPVTPFQQNCTLVWSQTSKRGAVIDPGGDLAEIERAIEEAGVTVEKIWLPHGHIDHASGATELKERLRVPIEGPHRADLFLLERLVDSARAFGMAGARNVKPDRWLDQGDRISVDDLTFDVLHCPGHSPGSVAFFHAAQRFAVVGDVLFRGSVGRSDIPGGNHQTLIASIKTKLLPLGDDVSFICGHGPTSTIGHERATNPFLQ